MPHFACIDLSQAQRRQLLCSARRSIELGIDTGEPLQLDIDELEPVLREPAAVFVTLTQEGDLRGCIGSLKACDALAQAVVNAAFNAALRDPRFARVGAAELDNIKIEISVLSKLQSWQPDSRESLLQELRPGIDGLLIEDLGQRATFLPQVWEKIPSANGFVGQLMLKAGLPARHWSSSIQLHRYQTLSFVEN
ncbi:MAG: AmmeMemoRadiSam system protein A [Gammaproteobacteria bacterium]|nr:AmmeMemoRadiSam system protein A [Gammaproteobacteria bacterium]